MYRTIYLWENIVINQKKIRQNNDELLKMNLRC